MQGVPLTNQQKALFLKKLLTTWGNVSRAARAIHVNRSTIYQHKTDDPDFSEAWEQVLAESIDTAEQELYRRAVKGWKEPVFYKGQRVADVKKWSDRALEIFLKANRPEKYRERFEVNNQHSGSLTLDIHRMIDQMYGDGENEEEQIGEEIDEFRP